MNNSSVPCSPGRWMTATAACCSQRRSGKMRGFFGVAAITGSIQRWLARRAALEAAVLPQVLVRIAQDVLFHPVVQRGGIAHFVTGGIVQWRGHVGVVGGFGGLAGQNKPD